MSCHYTLPLIFGVQSFVVKLLYLKKKITKYNNTTTTTTNNTLTRLPSAELIDLEQTACGQSVEGANFR